MHNRTYILFVKVLEEQNYGDVLEASNGEQTTK